MDRFILAGEHTVIDTETRLMWMGTDSMNDMEKWVNYPESVDYVRDLCESEIAGFNDWRLPSREEMATLFNKSYSLKDKFEKIIHINECFSPGGGFSVIAQQVSGRMRVFVLNLRTGEYTHPDGLWTITEAARAVRTIGADEKITDK